MHRILLVDDEKDILELIQSGLARKGYHVDTYSDSIEALNNFKSNFYDLIILDIKMPKMNGFELCLEIKKKDQNAKIHFLSAFALLDDLPKSIVSDLVGKNYIEKPVTIQKLVDVITKRLESDKNA